MTPSESASDERTDIMGQLEEALARLGRTLRRIKIPNAYLKRDIDINTYWQLSPLRSREAMRPSELAAQLALDNSTVSRQLQRLEAQGLVERTNDPADARAQLIRLTGDGRHMLDIVSSARRGMIASAVAHWEVQDQECILRLISQLTNELESEI